MAREARVVIGPGEMHRAAVVPEHHVALPPFVLLDEPVVFAMPQIGADDFCEKSELESGFT